MYIYDDYGWYSGEGEGELKRATNIVPTNTSQTTTDGELRSNWVHDRWVVVPYVTPIPPTAYVPYEITRMQAFRAMSQVGIGATIQTYIDTLPQWDDTRLTWETASSFKRDYPMFSLAAGLGITEEQIDQVFIQGALIE